MTLKGQVYAMFWGATLFLTMTLAACGPSGTTANSIHAGDRLTSFSQQLMSSKKQLNVIAGETFVVPVNVKNTGDQPWFGGEAKPMTVDVGYRWLDSKGGTLPIEGIRTQLTRSPVQPGESVDLNVTVGAPQQSGRYTLRVSMVQEGVQWFYLNGAAPLDAPATVH